MRQVKLYTLKEEFVSVTGDYAEIVGIHNLVTRVKYSNEYVVNTPIHVQRTPIERYVDVVKQLPEDVTYQQKESLVAFDPEIRKLLGINQKKVEDELRQLEIRYNELYSSKRVLVERVKFMNDLVSNYESELLMYKTMSFWKRLLFLFKGEI